MPGLVGFRKPVGISDAQTILHQMAQALEPENRFQIDSFCDDELGLARISLGILNPDPQPVWNASRNLCLFFHGELYDSTGLKNNLASRGYTIEAENDALFALHLYEALGDDFAHLLNGAFVIAIWDVCRKKLVVVNDRLGLHPIYYSHRPGHFAFASGVRSLLVDPELSRTIDAAAVAELLTFDHVLGQRTLLRDVHLMPQSSILTYQDGELSINPYYEMRFLEEYPIRPEAEYVEQFLFYMRQAVRRQDRDGLTRGLLLSGGLDSRFLLALLAENAGGRKLHTFTWGIPGCDDARLARETAAMVGADHVFYELKPDWLLDQHERCVRITDGLANLVNLHAIATLEEEAQTAKVIYKGFLGDAMLGFGLRPRYWANYSEENMVHAHLEAYRDYNVLTFDLPEHSRLFSEPFYRQVGNQILEDYRTGALAARSPQLADQRIYFDLTQRVPRMTLNGVQVVRDRAAVRLPFADNDLVAFSLTLPPWLRYERTLVTQAFIQAFPQLAKVPVTGTGLPMIACARELGLRARQFAQWHLNNAGLHWLAGPGKRPYKDYNKWFRTVMRTWIEDTLLSQRAMQRGYFSPEYVRSLVARHMSGENHAVRLGILMALELWHRQFIDESPAAVPVRLEREVQVA